MKKYYQILIIPLVVIYWFAITEIMHLLSQPSDKDVAFGIIGLSVLIAFTIFLTIKFKNNQKNENN